VQGQSNGGTAALTVATGFTNNGLLELTSIDGGFTSQLTVTTGPLTNAAAGTISSLAGPFGGARTLAAQLDNQGTLTVHPSSAGLLTLTGSLTTSGVLNIELGGLTAGTQYDRLAVSGTATLGGTLNYSLIGGFVPTTGNTFTILTAGSQTGSFGTVNQPGGWAAPTYTGTSVVLTAP